MSISFTADISRTCWLFTTPNWELELCSRAYADEVLSSWDAGAVAYDFKGCQSGGWQRSLRLPFVAAFLVRC